MTYNCIAQTEIARHYFPTLSPRMARQRLNIAIQSTPLLLEKLKKTGYSSRTHYLTPRQTEIIRKYLG